MATIDSVKVPYSGAIPGGVRRGLKIEIQGTVQQSCAKGAQPRFSVSLCQGPKKEPTTILFFNPRLDEQVIVLNHVQDNCWGTEQREEGRHFEKGKPFNLRIKVKPNIFKVKVDGRCVAVFDHRLPKETGKFIVIEGEVSVDFIKFTGGRGGNDLDEESGRQSGQVGQKLEKQVAQSAEADTSLIINPQIPLTTSIPGGLAPGRAIFISGVPDPDLKRFFINLQDGVKDGRDIAMHFDVRFHYANCNKLVIRNTLKNGHWGQRDECGPPCPFKPNENFDMVIRVEDKAFKVEVNDKHFVEYKHRLPLTAANTLNIHGDVKITKICFQ